MHTTNLRKAGGSIMLTIPPAILDVLHLEAGATVGLVVFGDRLVVEPGIKPRYTLDNLLNASGYSQDLPNNADSEEQGWLDAPALGRELL